MTSQVRRAPLIAKQVFTAKPTVSLGGDNNRDYRLYAQPVCQAMYFVARSKVVYQEMWLPDNP